MKTIKNYIGGQIGIPILLTFGSMLVGSVLWITNIGAEAKQAEGEIRERVVRLETSIENTDKNVAEIREDLKDIKTALRIK